MSISNNKSITQKVPDHSLTTGLAKELAPDPSGVVKGHSSAPVSGEIDAWGTAAQQTKGEVRDKFTYLFWKGVFEWILALAVTIILSPFLVLIAIVIRLSSPGNPIFCQERVGKGGRKFTFYKFRTMYANNDDGEYRTYIHRYITENAAYQVTEDGQGVYKVVNDGRVTRFGAWLRKTNLDELPQLINILKGEMSFIGPRPDIPFAVDMYQDWHRERLSVLPGMTGLWQVSQRKNLSFDDMTRLDIDYVRQQSLLLDVKILLLTILTVLRCDGS